MKNNITILWYLTWLSYILDDLHRIAVTGFDLSQRRRALHSHCQGDMRTPYTGPWRPSPECVAFICNTDQCTLSWAGTFTAIQLDELSITDKTQPVFNSFIHQAEDIPCSQQLPRPIGVESREQLHIPTKIAACAGMQVP